MKIIINMDPCKLFFINMVVNLPTQPSQPTEHVLHKLTLCEVFSNLYSFNNKFHFIFFPFYLFSGFCNFYFLLSYYKVLVGFIIPSTPSLKVRTFLLISLILNAELDPTTGFLIWTSRLIRRDLHKMEISPWSRDLLHKNSDFRPSRLLRFWCKNIK